MKIINIPNAITFVRAILGIISIYYLINLNFMVSGVFLVLFYVLDFFDGYFAKKLNQTTKFGAYFDTLLDGGVPLLYVLGMAYAGLVPLYLYFFGIVAMVIRGLSGFYLIKRNRHTSLSYNIKRVSEAIFLGLLILIVFGLDYSWYLPVPFIIYFLGAILALIYLKD